MLDNKPSWSIQNLTPKRLKIHGRDKNLLILAPLEKNLELSTEQLEPFDLDPLELQNIIKIYKEKELKSSEIPGALIGLGFWGVIFYIIGGNIFPRYYPELTMLYWFGVPLLAGAGLSIYSILASKKRLVIMRLITQFLSLLLILAIGIGLPTVAVYFFGGGREFFKVGEASLAMFGRSLQIIFIVTASLLPALLFFLFDRQQLGTLKDRFEQQIFRLDPNVKTLVDVKAKYGRQLAEIYGSDLATDQGRLIRANRSPIFVATLVITIGWILTLLPAEAHLVIEQPQEILKLFLPQRMAVTFGFLGSYFFALNTILRRYLRADLKPKAYSSITVRIFIVTILAWVFGLPFNSENSYVMATVFLIGIFPESGLTFIQETVRNRKRLFPSTAEKYPLTDLDEIDIYDRARLLDEGVTNIEGLAHHDLIDLMLETRIPPPRLVDWVDQAILYLHLPNRDQKDGTNVGLISFSWLKKYGIRTATDLLKTCDKGEQPLRKVLSGEPEKLKHLEVLLDVIKDDEWLNCIKHWRDNAETQEIPYFQAKAQTKLTDNLTSSEMPQVTVASETTDSEETVEGQMPADQL
jgi:hypothetical protein